MRTSVKGTADFEPNYPCLRVGKTSGAVVLFSNRHTGTVVHQGRGMNQVGHHSTSWVESFDTAVWSTCESVTLTNL